MFNKLISIAMFVGVGIIGAFVAIQLYSAHLTR